MPWCCDMSCSAVRSGGVPGHEPHFSVGLSCAPSSHPRKGSQVMILRDQYDRLSSIELAIADQWDDLSDKP